MDTNRRLIVALIIASALVGLFILSLLLVWIYHHKTLVRPYSKNGNTSDPPCKGLAPVQPMVSRNLNPLKANAAPKRSLSIDYKLLEASTSNFDEGGSGCLYKAQLEDGYYVAVKKVKVEGRDQDSVREFENEVDLLNKIKHPNVIALLGHCIDGDHRYLVYELMENGSLEDQLHGPPRGSSLSWHTRMKVALGVARGLEYLHEHRNPPVIHRDLKSSNILLDSNFNAKISQFGLAVADGHQNKSGIKLSGSSGPDYLSDEKSDVYAFGVVLLELLLGRKAVEEVSAVECQCIVTWAMPRLTDRLKLPSIVDPGIRDSMDLKHLYQVAAVAVLCVQPEPSYRPLITDVLHSLIPLVPVQLGGSLRFLLTEDGPSQLH